ncbi:hypothetical protein MBLNU459_g7974t1 [Dothideomycetes sp. NU459]
MSTARLDRIVKGAPPPDLSLDQVASAARRASSASSASVTAPQPPPAASDPLSSLPSSPEQIHLNLLILESSLRAQYLSLRARLRLYLVLMTALALWILSFTYLLFLRPREDGKGTGGSVYWVVDMAERLGWVGGVVTAGLVWGTGMWDRGVRWPRRWVGTTNRGLRGFNLKLVVIRGPWWREAIGYLALLDPLGWWGEVRGMRFELMPRDIEKSDRDRSRLWDHAGREGWIEEDVAPGGDVVKLLLLPKPFSPDFREDWDTYRTTYWDKENERRSELRVIIAARNRETAKKEGGWLWWTGWRGWSRLRASSRQHHVGPPPPHPPPNTVREKGSSTQLRDKKRRGDGLLLRDRSHSRSSSRSTTPDPDMRHPRRPGDDRLRRGSSAGQPAMPRKKRSQSSVSGAASSVPSRPSRLANSAADSDSRPSTPGSASTSPVTSEFPSLHKRSSNLSISSSEDGDVKKEETPPTDVTDIEIKEEPDEDKP